VMTFDKAPKDRRRREHYARVTRKISPVAEFSTPDYTDRRERCESGDIISDKDLIMDRLQRHSRNDLLIEQNERNERERQHKNAVLLTQVDGFEHGRDHQKYDHRKADVFGEAVK